MVERIELQDLRPKASSNTASFMKKQMIAERTRRSEFIQAEGSKAAMRLGSEGVKLVKANLVSAAARARCIPRSPTPYLATAARRAWRSRRLPGSAPRAGPSPRCCSPAQVRAEGRRGGGETVDASACGAERAALDTIAEAVEADGCSQTEYMLAKRCVVGRAAAAGASGWATARTPRPRPLPQLQRAAPRDSPARALKDALRALPDGRALGPRRAPPGSVRPPLCRRRGERGAPGGGHSSISGSWRCPPDACGRRSAVRCVQRWYWQRGGGGRRWGGIS